MTQGDSSTAPAHAPAHVGTLTVVVCVLTFRREALLAGLLPLLEAELDSLDSCVPRTVSARLVVVDNDPDRSASAVTSAHGSPRVAYCWEQVRGISAGRNRALDEAGDDDVLVFIDDDERPLPGWLCGLVSTHLTTGAALVAGPVVSQFLATPDPFVVAGGFFERAHAGGLRTGAALSRAATHNLLLDLHAVRRLGARFDPDFALSGGEDSVFTGTLTRAGARAVWCAEAVVTDLVPAERLTRAYALRRTRALSQSSVLAELRLRGDRGERTRFRLRVLAREGARLAAGVVQLALGRTVGSPAAHARGRRAVARAVGGLLAGFGRWPRTYDS